MFQTFIKSIQGIESHKNRQSNVFDCKCDRHGHLCLALASDIARKTLSNLLLSSPEAGLMEDEVNMLFKAQSYILLTIILEKSTRTVGLIPDDKNEVLCPSCKTEIWLGMQGGSKKKIRDPGSDFFLTRHRDQLTNYGGNIFPK